MLIELVSKWLICWAMWSLVVFDPDYDLTRYKSDIVVNKKFSKAQSMETFWLVFSSL